MKSGNWYLVYTDHDVMESIGHETIESRIPLDASIEADAVMEAEFKWTKIFKEAMHYWKRQKETYVHPPDGPFCGETARPRVIYEIALKQARQHWLLLCERIGGVPSIAEDVYEELVIRYSEPHRFYHTLKHIERCLDEYQGVRRFGVNPNAIELAIWFHDSIYEIGANDNEERSADLATGYIKRILSPSNILEATGNSSLSQSVTDLILATKYSKKNIDSDGQLLTDIDLSILGRDEEIFDEYEKDIRKEYSNIPEQEFIAGRSSMLKELLNKNIYSTSFFRDKYGAQARKNITRALNNVQL